MERFIRSGRPHIATGSDTDKRILDDSFAAMDETIQAKSADGSPNVWKTIVRSRMTKVAAAAAVIILAIGFLAIYQRPGEQLSTDHPSQVAIPPAEMLTYASLTIAYRQGGFEALDKQCEQAFELLGPRPEALSPQELLAEFNGS
jgi:hypothetical protein